MFYSRAIYFGLCILGLDLFSKFFTHNMIPLAKDMLYPYGGVGIFKNFLGIELSIIHATNTGAAWGVLADFQRWLLGVRILLILGMIGYLFFFNQRKTFEMPLVLIVAGALGNVLDFFFYGHVVDMIHFVFWGYDYPVFNLADSAITLGILWLVYLSWFTQTKETSCKSGNIR